MRITSVTPTPVHPTLGDGGYDTFVRSARKIAYYTVTYRQDASRQPQVCQIADRDRAWAFMREVDRAGGIAGFPQAVFE